MKPTEPEIRSELEALRLEGVLTRQEQLFLEHLVFRRLQGDTSELYQKGLATELGISNAKQIGVLATRVRAKLLKHYARRQALHAVRIDLAERGYEPRFSYRDRPPDLSERAQLLVANARAAIDQRSLPGATAALNYLDEALQSSPDHPLLLALKAYCYSTRALFGTLPEADLRTADGLLARVPDDPAPCWEYWFSLACVEMTLRWNWPAASRLFAQAIEATGGEAQRQPWYCAFLWAQGRAAESISILLVSANRFHDSPIVRADLAASQIYAGRFDDASHTIHTARDVFGPRTHYLMWVYQAMIEEAHGRPEQAVATLNQVPLRWPQTSITLGLRAYFSGLAGDRRTARRHYLKLRAARMVAGQFVPASQLFAAAYGAGEHGAAFEWLRVGAADEHDPNLVLAAAYPFFRHLHDIAEFRTIVTEVLGLALPTSAVPAAS